MAAPLLDVSGLEVAYPGDPEPVCVVAGVDLSVGEGEILGIVGESGSGKTMTAYAILGLIDPPGRVTAGRILFKGRDLLQLPEAELRALRGNQIAIVLQDPTIALNPVLTIGRQMVEAMTFHRDVPTNEAWDRSIEALGRLGIANPAERMRAYPHQLSGGMLQRVVIAIALLNGPSLLIADEPTTALDVSIQAQILHEFQGLLAALGTSALWISHDLSVVSSIADRIAVMYSGRVVETGEAQRILTMPSHPYTRGLLDAFPDGLKRGERLAQIKGAIASPADRPTGCAFRPRCARATGRCEAVPPPRVMAPHHIVSCFHPIAAETAR